MVICSPNRVSSIKLCQDACHFTTGVSDRPFPVQWAHRAFHWKCSRKKRLLRLAYLPTSSELGFKSWSHTLSAGISKDLAFFVQPSSSSIWAILDWQLADTSWRLIFPLNGWRNSLKYEYILLRQFQFSSVTQLCPTLCDPIDCSTPGLPVHHQLPEFTQTRVHWVGEAIQPSHPLLSLSPPAFNPSPHQGLFKWVSSSHQVAKGLEFQLLHQSFQWIFRTDFL